MDKDPSSEFEAWRPPITQSTPIFISIISTHLRSPSVDSNPSPCPTCGPYAPLPIPLATTLITIKIKRIIQDRTVCHSKQEVASPYVRFISVLIPNRCLIWVRFGTAGSLIDSKSPYEWFVSGLVCHRRRFSLIDGNEIRHSRLPSDVAASHEIASFDVMSPVFLVSMCQPAMVIGETRNVTSHQIRIALDTTATHQSTFWASS